MGCQRCGAEWQMRVSAKRKFCAPCRRIRDRESTYRRLASDPNSAQRQAYGINGSARSSIKYRKG